MPTLAELRATPATPAEPAAPTLAQMRAASFNPAPASSTEQGAIPPGADPGLLFLSREVAARQKAEADVQRQATPLERALDLLQSNLHGNVGAIDAALSLKNPLEGAKAGVRSRMNVGDLFRKRIPEMIQGMHVPPAIPGAEGVQGPTVRQLIPFAGFAGDVALDPVSYAGLGGLTRAGEAAKAATVERKLAELSGDAARLAPAQAAEAKAGTLASGLAAQTKAGQRALFSFAGQPIVSGKVGALPMKAAEVAGEGWRRAVGPLFDPASSLKGVDRDVFRARAAQVGGAQALADYESQSVLGPIMARIDVRAKTLGLDPAEVDKGLAQTKELMSAPFSDPQLAADAHALASATNTIDARNFAAKQAAGIKIGELTGIGYMRHTLTPEAKRVIDEFGPDEMRGVGRQFTERHGAQIKRSFVHPDGTPMDVNEINALVEQGGSRITGYHPVPGGLFQANPALATAIGNRESAKAIESANLINDYSRLPEFAKTPATTAEHRQLVRDGWRTVPNDLQGVGDQVLFRPDIAEALKRKTGPVLDPHPLLQAYDKGLTAWKRYTLGIFPVYHTRNEIDDLFRAVGYGGMNPARLADSARLSTWGTPLWRGGPMPTVNVGGKTLTAEEFQKLALKHNVSGSMTRAEMGTTLFRPGAKPGGVTGVAGAISDNPLTRLGQQASRVRENWTRHALFLDRLTKGDSPEAAAAFTNKMLFDYGDNPPFVNEFLARLFPFIRYTIKNTPLAAEMALKRPGVVSGVEKAREEIAGGQPLGLGDRIGLPYWLRDALPVRVGRNAQGDPEFLRLEGQLGVTDLNQALSPSAAFQKGLDLLSPGIKTPAEMAMNYSTFRHRPLEESPGQTARFLGVPMSRRWAIPVLENARPLSEINRLFGIGPSASYPSTGQRVANLFAGRTYSVSKSENARRQGQALEKEMANLARQMRYAKTAGEKERIKRLMDQTQAAPYNLNF